jgi:LytS/YehU family sensor histidine kinase
LLYAFYGVVIRLALDWFERREDKKEMEQQHIKTELALLRLQINPHFLFNTLNNINSFALTEPDKASFAIIKLSGIMRYMLYEAQAERVLLEKEIAYIKDYLALQKIRSAQPNLVDFYTSDIPENLLVPPMLFIPFIENAFKHGKKMGSAEISISLLFVEGALIFKCKNQKRVLNETEESGKKGIGIENIQRRLALLFPGKSTLEIQDLPDIFNVELKIKMG